MDEEGRPVRAGAVDDEAEIEPGEDGAEGLHLGLAEMHHDERDHLHQDAALFKAVLESEDEEAAEEELGGEEGDGDRPGVCPGAEVHHVVVALESRPPGGEIEDRSADKAGDTHISQPLPDVAQAEAEVQRIFTQEEDDNQQRQDGIIDQGTQPGVGQGVIFPQGQEQHGRTENNDFVTVLGHETADSTGLVTEKSHGIKINPKNRKYKL